MPLVEGSLCTGYNGLGRAVAQAIGAIELAWVSDVDSAASRLLAHNYPNVPNLGDLTQVDWSAVAPVDLLSAGWPCQPWSLAGKQLGAADERAIWPAVAGAVRVLRPRYVFLENVSAIIAAGELARAIADLAALGYVGSWRCLRASDIGAAHRRDRVFILAQQASESGQSLTLAAAGSGRRRGVDSLLAPLLPTPRASTYENAQTKRTPSQKAGKHGLSLAAEVCELLPTPRAIPLGQEEDPKRWLERNAELAANRSRGASGMPLGVAVQLLPTPRATDGVNGGPNQRDSNGEFALPATVQPGRWGGYAAAIARWEQVTGQAAPDPTEPGKNGPRLASTFVEWLMGLPAGWVTDVPGISRNDQLRLLGNGVVPQQGAEAFRRLTAAMP